MEMVTLANVGYPTKGGPPASGLGEGVVAKCYSHAHPFVYLQHCCASV